MPSRISPAALLLLMQVTACTGSDRPHSDQRAPRAVTASSESASLVTRTHPTGTIFATIGASGRPFGIALSHTGVVYCTLLDAASLARTTIVPDSLTALVVADIPTDVAFSPDGSWAYVTNQGARTIGIVNTRINQQVDAVPVEGDPFRVVVGPEGQVIYATTNAGNLVQIDPQRRAVSWTIHLGGNLNGLAINPEGTRVYVGDVGGKVYEVGADGGIIRSLAVPGRPQGLVLSRGGNELYVAGEAGNLVVLALETGTEVARIPLAAGGFGLAVTPDQAQIWVTAPRTGQVFVLDRLSRAIVNTIAVGGIPRRIAFDRSGATAVIADEAGAIRFVR
jgi:YVTN family beta-propeller protein